MASPFTITPVSNYNANPPSDDGAQTASNRVQWSTQKTKLSDPIKTAFDSSETATSTAIGKMPGGAGITTTAISYTVTFADQGKLVKATASGITITTPDATVVGSPFFFRFLNASSGDITFDGNGTQTVDGDLSFTVPAGCGIAIDTDGSNWFTNGRNFNNVLQEPQGYLTLTSGTPIITGDVSAATSVYYTPFKSDRVPISTDGVSFKMRQFSELTLSLVANHLASTIYDIFLFDNAGTITIGTGPAWNTNTAGSCARGTGAGTTDIHRLHGVWTNVNSMTVRNGSTTYTVAANEGTYVGSIFIDGSAGQVTCHRSWGQSRKWGVWNAYNRCPIYLQEGDSTSSWSYSTNTVRPSNGSTANSITTFCGLPEEQINSTFTELVSGVGNNSTSATYNIGIGLNSTTSFGSCLQGELQVLTTSGTGSTRNIINLQSQLIVQPSLGINVLTALETCVSSGSGVSAFGTTANMLLAAQWRG